MKITRIAIVALGLLDSALEGSSAASEATITSETALIQQVNDASKMLERLNKNLTQLREPSTHLKEKMRELLPRVQLLEGTLTELTSWELVPEKGWRATPTEADEGSEVPFEDGDYKLVEHLPGRINEFKNGGWVNNNTQRRSAASAPASVFGRTRKVLGPVFKGVLPDRYYQAGKQYVRSNTLTGEESASCQNWQCFQNLGRAGWQMMTWQADDQEEPDNGKVIFVHYNGNLISTVEFEDPIAALECAQAIYRSANAARPIQSANPVTRICFPYALHYAKGGSHLITFVVEFNDKGMVELVRMLDPLSTTLGSNTTSEQLCQEALRHLHHHSPKLNTSYISVDIQVPATGNCQKLALYMAVYLCEKTTLEVSRKEAITFCTELHKTSQTPPG